LTIESLEFGHVFGHEDIATEHKTKLNSVVLFKKFDEGRNDYEGEFSNLDDLSHWIDEHSFATVMRFVGDRAIEKVFQQSTPTIFLFHDDSDTSKHAEKLFSEIAHLKKKGKVLFSDSKPGDELFEKLA